MANKNLNKAKEAKKDEFYTQLEDINNELKHYREHFRGKTVLCNCDDPRVSNFFTYFAYNFEFLGLRKLITTCYKNQDADLFSQNKSEQAVYLVYEGDKNGDHIPNADEIGVIPLKGNGDFRSKECIENAIKYKEIFPLIQQNKLWLGYGFKGGAGHFISHYEDTATAGDHREGMIRVSGVTWFTNLEIKKRHENLILYKHYTPKEYPKFENFDAININRTEDIPCDYNGVMGVPITFMDKYNPEQFEILGVGIAGLGLAAGVKPYKPEHKKYRKEIQKRGAVDGDLYMMNGEEVVVPYSRILIQRKK